MKLGQILYEAKSSKLNKEIIEHMKDALEECNDLPDWQWKDPEEIESSSIDGEVVVSAYTSADYLVGSGTCPKAAQKTLDGYQSDANESAVEDTLSEFPELKKVKFDIDYSTLQDNDMNDAAEYLYGQESEWLGDIALDFVARVQFYDIDNSHGKYKGKSDSMTVICDLSWDGQKGEEAYKEINFKVDLSTEDGMKQAKDDIDSAIYEVVKIA